MLVYQRVNLHFSYGFPMVFESSFPGQSTHIQPWIFWFSGQRVAKTSPGCPWELCCCWRLAFSKRDGHPPFHHVVVLYTYMYTYILCIYYVYIMYILCIPDIYIYIITRYYLSTYCWVIHQIFPDRQGQDGSLAVPAGHVLLLGAMGAMSQRGRLGRLYGEINGKKWGKCRETMRKIGVYPLVMSK